LDNLLLRIFRANLSVSVKHLERLGGGHYNIHPRIVQPQHTAFKPNSALLNAVAIASKANMRLESLMIINQLPTWACGDFFIPTYAYEMYKAAFASIKTLMISVGFQGPHSQNDDSLSSFEAFLDILPRLEHLRANL
jgi:hypothetical protein